jgi:exopolysaccharide biosynthesis polyprenyl glycosylphosphotransferase
MRHFFGHHMAKTTLFLGVLEASLIAAICCAAYNYGYSPSDVQSGRFGPLTIAMLMAIAIVGLMLSGGLYETTTLTNLKKTIWRLGLIAIPIFALAVWTTAELAKTDAVPIYPYRWQWTLGLTAAWLLAAISLRALYCQAHQSGRLATRVMLVGTSKLAAELSDLEFETLRPFHLVGHNDIGNPDASLEVLSPTLTRSCSEFLAQSEKKRATEIVVGGNGKEVARWKDVVRNYHTRFRVTAYQEFFERESGRVCVDALDEDWFAHFGRLEPTGFYARAMRAFDIAFSLLGIFATAPVMLLTALAIKCEDGGSVLYSQERSGIEGRTFRVFKFRSMREDAERDGTPTWASENDNRITAVGRVIRKLRIDELPQFFNVLWGDMAVIGPRPERPFFVMQFTDTIPGYQYRHCVKPGITGWAQVKFRYGASLEDTKRKLSYDLYYVKNRSLLLNSIIIVKTVGVMLRGEGAR